MSNTFGADEPDGTATRERPLLAAARVRNANQRLLILETARNLEALHIAPAFSCLELVDTVHFHLMKHGADPDVFILSKGHGAMALYAVMWSLGILTRDEVLGVCRDGSTLGGHPDRGVHGIAASTGSLGHGLPIALGIARGAHELNRPQRVFVLMGDGELMEGSVWESLLLAPSWKLNNVVVLVDHNLSIARGRIPDVHPNLLPVSPKLRAFGWETFEVDGHDPQAIIDAHKCASGDLPIAIVALTTKGKGVSFMENEPIWAYRSPSAEEHAVAVRELEAQRDA